MNYCFHHIPKTAGSSLQLRLSHREHTGQLPKGSTLIVYPLYSEMQYYRVSEDHKFDSSKPIKEAFLRTYQQPKSSGNASIVCGHYTNIHQDGKTVFKYAVSEMSAVTKEIMKRNELDNESIDYLVPHQANKRIIDATTQRLDLNPNKVMMNIEYYGNTTAATLPLLLNDYENKLNIGDKLVFAAFGGGFTWGAAYLTWAY